MNTLKSAYGAGYRAGMARQALITHLDGTKTLHGGLNPFFKWSLKGLLWDMGKYDGMMKRLTSKGSK